MSQPTEKVNFTSRFPKNVSGMLLMPVLGWLFTPPSLLKNKVALWPSHYRMTYCERERAMARHTLYRNMR